MCELRRGEAEISISRDSGRSVRYDEGYGRKTAVGHASAFRSTLRCTRTDCGRSVIEFCKDQRSKSNSLLHMLPKSALIYCTPTSEVRTILNRGSLQISLQHFFPVKCKGNMYGASSYDLSYRLQRALTSVQQLPYPILSYRKAYPLAVHGPSLGRRVGSPQQYPLQQQLPYPNDKPVP